MTDLEKRLIEAIEAKNELLVCYRISRRPSEPLWERVRKADDTLKVAQSLQRGGK